MAQAVVVHDHGQEESFCFGTFLCLDEEPWIDQAMVRGPLRWISHTTLDGAGGFHWTYHETFRFSGVSDITGYHDVGHWAVNESWNGRVGEVFNWSWPAVAPNLDTNRNRKAQNDARHPGPCRFGTEPYSVTWASSISLSFLRRCRRQVTRPTSSFSHSWRTAIW